MRMETRIFPDLEAMSVAAMDEMIRIISETVSLRGRFTIALSGGHTPIRMFQLWAGQPYRDNTPWDKVYLFWGDERYVPHQDERSNFRLARDSFISRVPIPARNVHPIPTGSAPADKSAETYEKELRDFFGPEAPQIDLQLQGVGAEGHTASLFPGSPALTEKRAWVLPVMPPPEVSPPVERITMTPVVLNRGRNTFFLVSGEDKRPIIAGLRAETSPQTSRYPAAHIQPPGPVLWFLDRAAAG
jgi:6-phosphogluconolactonase